MVPCDSRLVEADDLQVLEVNLTGAVKSVRKDPDFLRYTHDVPPSQQANMLFASSIIVNGSAKVIVCCIGDENLVCKLEKNKPIVSKYDIKPIDTQIETDETIVWTDNIIVNYLEKTNKSAWRKKLLRDICAFKRKKRT